MSALRSINDDVLDLKDLEPAVAVRKSLLWKDNSSDETSMLGLSNELLPATYADLDTSKKKTDFDRLKSRLIAAVKDMRAEAPTWDGISAKVEPAAALAAQLFLACLPENRTLPKVAADGEGDVMFVWDNGPNSCIVTVEPTAVHLVHRPGTAQTEHVDARPFYGEHLPVSILARIPMK